MKAITAMAIFALLVLFGCTQPQQQSPQDTAGDIAEEIQTYESELSDLDTEFAEIDQILNDSEMENIEFVELEESAFQ